MGVDHWLSQAGRSAPGPGIPPIRSELISASWVWLAVRSAARIAAVMRRARLSGEEYLTAPVDTSTPPAEVNCSGVFLTARLSQDSRHPTSTAEWGFDTNGALRCGLSFWVAPISGATGPAWYDLIAANGRVLAHYTINQGLDVGLFVTSPAMG